MTGTEHRQLPLTTAAASVHTVIDNVRLAVDVHRLEVIAPRIATATRPGQFVIVRLGPGAERIPLTVADADPGRGSVSLVVQAVGKSTIDLVALEAGQSIDDVAGPLGRPSTHHDRQTVGDGCKRRRQPRPVARARGHPRRRCGRCRLRRPAPPRIDLTPFDARGPGKGEGPGTWSLPPLSARRVVW